MGSGLCCAAQAAGDLGKPLIVTVHKKDGSTVQRCGVCEVVPSCRHPQVLVFAFRFIKSMACGIAGRTSCKPTAGGIAEYRAQIPIAARGAEAIAYYDPSLQTRALPPTGRAPYTLPLQ